MSLAKGWPYAQQTQRFAPQLTVNKITPENVNDRKAELSAQLLEQRTYNNAISDLRLGEAEAAAMQRRDFAPVARAVEQLGTITGLAAVAPDALAESYKTALEKAAGTKDFSKVLDEVVSDLEKKVESGEIDKSDITGIRDKIEEITIPVETGKIEDPTGKLEWDSTTGELKDNTGKKLADAIPLERGRMMIKFADGSTQNMTGVEWNAIFNAEKVWKALKSSKNISAVNALYAKIDPTAPPQYKRDETERELSRDYLKLNTAPLRKKEIIASLGEQLAAGSTKKNALGDILDIAADGSVELKLDDGGKRPAAFDVALGDMVQLTDKNTGHKWTLTPQAFAIWMDAAGLMKNKALSQYVVPVGKKGRRGGIVPKTFAMNEDLRRRVIKTELDKKVSGSTRVNYFNTIADIYAKTGVRNEPLNVLADVMSKTKHTLEGEGAARALVGGKTFKGKTAEIGKKLFNEISAQLDALESAGKITPKQRDRVIKKAARDLGIKLP